KKTGQQMTHYIIRGGRFQTAVYDLLKNGFSISWYDKWSEGIIAVSKTNSDILDDWLRVTDKSEQELINKLTQTVSKRNDTSPDDIDIIEPLSGLEPEPPVDVKPPVKGTGTRTKFTCPGCGLNAWAKPSANLICGECGVELMA
ncbi:sprT domain-containing protein, partial [Salmonella enterica]|nr:sprT domain-containing protein [Salmonella enterica]